MPRPLRKNVSPRPRSAARPAVAGLLFTTLLAATAAADPTEEGHAHEHPHDDHGVTETIVVTATPLEHDRDELSVPVDRIERDELIEHLGSTLGETLDHIPGIASTGFAAGASRPVVRGQDAYRTEVLEDGLRTQDVSRESPDHAVPVNPLAAERIEVVRGPATLRYGGGASAGVVNVITNRVPDRLPTEEGISGEVFGGIGLVAGERDLAASLEGASGQLAWHADGLFRLADDYTIPNDDEPDTQAGTFLETWMGSAGAAWIGERGRLGASYTRLENDYGIPDDEPVEIDMSTDRFRFEGDLFDPLPGIREARVRGVYSDYQHDEVADGEIGQTYRNEEFEGRLELLHEPLLGLTGAFGLYGSHRDFRGEGEAEEFLAPTETRTVAAYLFEELPLGADSHLELGFRVEHTNVEGTDVDGVHREFDFVPLSGALGLVTEPTTWLTIGANASVSQRAPSQVELLARGPHEATETFELGNSDLREETSYTGEVRFELKPTRGRLETAFFVTQYDDYIFAALTGATVDEEGLPVAPGDDALDLLRYVNRDALFWGTEVAGELDVFELPCGRFGIDGRFDYVRARFDSRGEFGSRDLPRIVPIRWGGGVWFRSEATDARIGFLRTEAQEKIGAFEEPTASYTHLNASLTHRLLVADTVPLELSVTARNLTDVRGRNHLAFNKEEVLLPGRAIRFGVRARF